MSHTTGAASRKGSFLDEVRDAVTPRATLLVLGVLALQLLFIASYVGALHDPKPRDVPFGVVAPGAAAGRTVAQLEGLPGTPLDPRAVRDEAGARKKIMDREIDGALVVDPRGTRDTLLVASRRHRPRHHPEGPRHRGGAGRAADRADRRRGPGLAPRLRRAVLVLPGRRRFGRRRAEPRRVAVRLKGCALATAAD
ncbi:hypothetical protein SFUMM280S_04929 [Streptomyces fumanus]